MLCASIQRVNFPSFASQDPFELSGFLGFFSSSLHFAVAQLVAIVNFYRTITDKSTKRSNMFVKQILFIFWRPSENISLIHCTHMHKQYTYTDTVVRTVKISAKFNLLVSHNRRLLKLFVLFCQRKKNWIFFLLIFNASKLIYFEMIDWRYFWVKYSIMISFSDKKYHSNVMWSSTRLCFNSHTTLK